MTDNSREILLRRIQVCDFVLTDTSLYLDTHPTDRKALDHYQKHLEMRNKAHMEYTENYGPLTHADYDGGDRWNWVDGPWPWQTKREDL